MAIRKRGRILNEMPQPIHYASGYTLDLYCRYDNPEHERNQGRENFIGETFKECRMDSIRAGWSMDLAQRLATCPLCVRKIADWKRANDPKKR